MSNQKNIPFITTNQMREVDRLMIEKYGILLPQMMENAGNNLARLAQQRFLKTTKDKKILIVVGRGGNGGGALVSARHMKNWGYDVEIVLLKPEKTYTEVTQHQLNIVLKMGINVKDFNSIDKNFVPFLIIDGLIGYSLQGTLSDAASEMIQWLNSLNRPILALDMPSGLDGTKGYISETLINANTTMTLALPKSGLADKSARAFVGDLYLADIGVPPQLYQSHKLEIEVGNLFTESPIIRIW